MLNINEYVAVLIAVSAVSVASFWWWKNENQKTVINVTCVELPKREIWSLDQIAEFDGAENKPILIGIEGLVYDVSAGRDYYGKGGGYAVMAGKDATRYLAKTILNPEKDDGKPLTADEKENLKQWIEFFTKKYPVVGKFQPVITY